MDKFFYKQDTLTDIPLPKEKGVELPPRIGPYKIESLLNKGGMSILYLGFHPDTKETLVIKVLSPKHVKNSEMIERFLKEAKIIALTNHPNIVKLYGQGQWEGGMYIAMEFIRGVSLRQFISQHSLSLKRSIDIILQVAYALYHLHSHGVIHGDLKPENILITEDGEVKVIDFGIARLKEELKKTSTKNAKIAGTPSYMSPEQKEGPTKMTFASDIYSLGVIAYELAMGKLSFGVIHLSLVPKGLRVIIEKALAVSLTARYPDILSFITDLSQYLKSGGLEKDRPGTDQLKEFLERIQLTSLSLSPSILPSWPQIELGIAKYKAPGQVGAYFDFFRFSNNSFGIFIAETTETTIDSSIFIGIFRGMIRTLLAEKKDTLSRPSNIAASLNRLLREDPIARQFGLAFLMLNPFNDELFFIACGLGGLIRASQGSEHPKKLSNLNPLLGKEANREFFETHDNWEVGDTLTLHSLDTSLDTLLFEALSENVLLSAQGQAEAILKKTSAHPSFSQQKNPKVLITIQRVG